MEIQWTRLETPVAAEQIQPQEAGLQEEGKHSFRGEGGTENITHVFGVVGPVGAELELHHNAGGHAHREGQREQLAEKYAHLCPFGTSFFPAQPFGNHQEPGESDGYRGKNKVKSNGQCELNSRRQNRIHNLPPFIYPKSRFKISIHDYEH